MGWREWVALPELNIPAIKAKIDTGAKTSALHAFKVKRIQRNTIDKVQFSLHPVQRNHDIVLMCEARLIDERAVCNSGGQWEKRYVIQTLMTVGETTLPIEITLTNRDKMGFRMLLGRQALRQYEHLLIDPAQSYLAGSNDLSTEELELLYPALKEHV